MKTTKPRIPWIGAALLAVGCALVFIGCQMTKTRVTRSHVTCLANLKMIDGLKMQWALQNRKSPDDTPTGVELWGAEGYLPGEPKCPQGGIYSINNIRTLPSCSLADKHPHHALKK